jgi:hypothetical protein
VGVGYSDKAVEVELTAIRHGQQRPVRHRTAGSSKMTQPSEHATRTSRYVNQKSGKTSKIFNIQPPGRIASGVNVINAPAPACRNAGAPSPGTGHTGRDPGHVPANCRIQYVFTIQFCGSQTLLSEGTAQCGQRFCQHRFTVYGNQAWSERREAPTLSPLSAVVE